MVTVAYKSFFYFLLERYYPANADHPDKIIKVRYQGRADAQIQDHNISIKV